MSTTAAPGRRHPRGRCGPEPLRRRSSAPSGRSRWRLKGAAAAGNTRLGPELAELSALQAAHGRDALTGALRRAVAFGRWHAADVRSILDAGTGVSGSQNAGQALVIELPVTNSRSLQEYSLQALQARQAASGEPS
jgi:hypothetical protein